MHHTLHITHHLPSIIQYLSSTTHHAASRISLHQHQHQHPHHPPALSPHPSALRPQASGLKPQASGFMIMIMTMIMIMNMIMIMGMIMIMTMDIISSSALIRYLPSSFSSQAPGARLLAS